MTDIVERLRWPAYPPDPSGLMLIAADEITRLRGIIETLRAEREFEKQQAEIEQLRAEIDEWRHRAETAEARLGIVSAICLECWREGRNKTIYPMGYYNVPCLRHGQERPNEPIRLITEADIRNDKRGTS